jgi:hypothetical protein
LEWCEPWRRRRHGHFIQGRSQPRFTGGGLRKFVHTLASLLNLVNEETQREKSVDVPTFAEGCIPLDGRMTFKRILQFANKYGLCSIQTNTGSFSSTS